MIQLVKNPPAVLETWVQSLGWEDPLEKGKLLTPVFWPGEFHGLCSLWVTKSQRRLSDFQFYFSSKCTVYVVGSVLIRDKKHDI